ncbi:hypothetical protein AB2709_19350 [Klebsiella quasipneumoniae]
MKSNTLRKRPTDVPVQKASEQPGKDLREADKQRQHKEFIAAMGNAVNLLMTILICSHSILVTSG